MKTPLYMRDFLTLSVRSTDESKKYLHECKDSQSESGYSLLTRVDATHSGVVNGNARFYRPDMMQNSAHTWAGTKWSKRPVLAHHNEDSDPIGRVATWKYVDERHLYLAQHSVINKLHFYDAVSKGRLDLFKSVQWVYDNLQKKNKDYTGLGKIQLGLNLTNPDAIAKVQREEYKTVSVGFTTDAAICSICHQDWGEDGRCEHRLGSMVDGERCFLISGNQDFRELSFVTFPADHAGVVINHEVVQAAKDSLALRTFFLGHSFEEVTALHQTDALVSDLIESDISIATDEEETDMDLKALRAEISSPELTKDRALELRNELAGEADAKRLLNTLNAKIRKNSWSESSDSTAPSKEEVELKIAALADLKASMDDEAFAAHLAVVKAEADAHGLEIPALEDKQEEEKQEEVKSGEKDTKHALAADADVATIKLHFSDSAEGKSFVELIEKAADAFKTLPDEEKYTGLRLIYQYWDILGDAQSLEWMKQRLASTEEKSEEDAIDSQELTTLNDAVESYEAEIETLKGALCVARDTNKSLVAQMKQTLATAVVTYSVAAKETGFEGLDAAGIEAEIAERSQRQLVSLQDSLKDVRKKLHKVEVTAQAASTETPNPGSAQADSDSAVEGVKEVSDTAKVQDSADQPQAVADEAQTADAKERKAVGVRPFATLADIQALNQSAATMRYKALKERASKKD